LGEVIFWDNLVPSDIGDGSCHFPRKYFQGQIQIRKDYDTGTHMGQERSFEELWSTLVQELYSIANANEMKNLRAKALEGDISKFEYAQQVLENEYHAAQKTRAYYLHVFFPWAKQHHVPTHPDLWHLILNNVTSDPLSTHPYYEDQYFLAILLEYFQNGEYQKAIDYSKKCLVEIKTKSTLGDILDLRGYCLLKQHNPKAAVEAFNQAIDINPADLIATVGRAAAYGTKNDYVNTTKDVTTATETKKSHPEGPIMSSEIYECLSADQTEAQKKEIAEQSKKFQNEVLREIARIQLACGYPVSSLGDCDKAK
jgi:tetratricopeptide (TPR) repeat protein